MAGYFSNSGEGDSPNAAKQFEREFADNPGSFGGEGGGILGRLLGARQPNKDKITTTVLDDQTPPQPSSNVSSAPALVTRIINTMRPPAPPPGQFGGAPNTDPALAGIPPQPTGPLPPFQRPGMPGQNAAFPGGPFNMPPGGPFNVPPDSVFHTPPGPTAPFQGLQNGAQPPQGGPPQGARPPYPLEPPPPPDMSQPPLPQTSRPQNGPQAQQQSGWLRNLLTTGRMFPGRAAALRQPPQAPQSLQMPYNPAHHPSGPRPMPGANIPAGGMTPEAAEDFNDWYRQAQRGPGGPGNYAQGGYLRMMRGGYPSDLMMGMPMRRDYGRGNYVTPDGQGDGRSDHVEARLSPGEFVVDAESVSMLGNGDNAAGARKLEEMRRGVRKQKGKALVKGKFSPDAKSPESYMRGKS
tara:strand:+ start:1460 stop:2683 length:1224 start_codon:yes stop_codon:yes gene_type:complete